MSRCITFWVASEVPFTADDADFTSTSRNEKLHRKTANIGRTERDDALPDEFRIGSFELALKSCLHLCHLACHAQVESYVHCRFVRLFGLHRQSGPVLPLPERAAMRRLACLRWVK